MFNGYFANQRKNYLTSHSFPALGLRYPLPNAPNFFIMGKFKIDWKNKRLLIFGSYLPYELSDFMDDHDYLDWDEFPVEHFADGDESNSGDYMFPEEQKDSTF